MDFALLTSHRAHNATFAKVVVGRKAQSFTVHLDLLTYHSPFFRAALTGSFKEAEKKLVTLSETYVETFELFVHWLYHQQFPTDVDSPQLLALYHDDEDSSFQFEVLVRLYVFCDKYDVPGLKRQCLDALFDHLTDAPELPHLNDVGIAFDNLDDKDPLRRMITDSYCYWSSGDCWEASRIQNLPSAFLAEVLSQYSEFALGGRDWAGTPELCNYHAHATTEERVMCEERREKAEQVKDMLMS
jgi:hypothetical protein